VRMWRRIHRPDRSTPRRRRARIRSRNVGCTDNVVDATALWWMKGCDVAINTQGHAFGEESVSGTTDCEARRSVRAVNALLSITTVWRLAERD
jgi:hypothetical protein